jgi:hypothetical protein
MEEIEEVQLDGFQSIVVIALQRLYDVQMTMLMHMNPTKAEQLAQLHEQGRTLSPPFTVAASVNDLDL